jgi:excisionase family DNA binding protein
MNLLTVKEVAQQLKINKMTVYDLLRQNEIPAAQIRGQYRIRQSDLESYVDNLIDKQKEAIQCQDETGGKRNRSGKSS